MSRRTTPRANARHRLIAVVLCALPFVSAAVITH
jgi:hypothetical protein